MGRHSPAIGCVRDTIGRHAHETIRDRRVCSGLIMAAAAITHQRSHSPPCSRHRRRRGSAKSNRPLQPCWRLWRASVTATRTGSPVARPAPKGSRRAGARHPDSAPRPARFRAGPSAGSDPEASVPASDLLTGFARPGCHHRLRRKLRAGRRQGNSFSADIGRRPAPGTASLDPRGMVHADRHGSTPRASAGSAPNEITHPAAGLWVNTHQRLCEIVSRSPVHLSGAFAGRLAPPSGQPLDDYYWPIGTNVNTSTRLRPAPTSATMARPFSYASDARTVNPGRVSSGFELHPRPQARDGEIDMVPRHTPTAPLAG